MQDLDKCSQEINVKSTEDLSCSISEDSGLDLEAAERLAAESFTSIDVTLFYNFEFKYN